MEVNHERPQLQLHVRLEDREDLRAHDAVQGALFETEEVLEAKRGYRGTVASKVAGITYRQLDYWARKQILVPSLNPSHGSGTRRLYSFKDVVILAVSKRLLDAGVNLNNVTKAIGFLTQRSTSALENIVIVCDGDNVQECTENSQMLDLMNKGNAVFGVSVGALWHQMEEALETENYVNLENKAVRVNTGNAIDELAERRLRHKLEVQKAQRNERTSLAV